MANSQAINIPGVTFHAVAAAAISAGDLVYSSSSDDVMTAISQAGYVEASVGVTKATTSQDALIVGIALTDAASGETISVATRGIFIMAVDAAAGVTTGALIEQGGTAQSVKDSAAYTNVIGRALTGGTAAASKYALVLLRV